MRHFIILLFTCSWACLFGQGQFGLQWDRPYYAAGETVHYTVAQPPFFTKANGVLQVKVAAVNHPSYVHYSFLKDPQVFAKGIFNIPIDAPSDEYNIQISALDRASMKQISICSGAFTVTNPYNDNDIPTVTFRGGEKGSLDATIRKAGDHLDVQVAGQPGSATMSLMLTNKGMIYGEGTTSTGNVNISAPITIQQPSADLFYVGDAGKQTDSTYLVLGAYMSTTDNFIYADVQDDRTFVLLLPDFYGQQDLQFMDQVLNPFPVKHDKMISIQSNHYIDQAVVEDYIKDYLDQKRIEQYFGVARNQIIEDVAAIEATSKKATRVLNLRDYENFIQLSKFFQEVSTPLKFDESKGNFTAKVANTKYRGLRGYYFDGDPLFIIDGQVTNDANFVAGLNFGLVNTVEIFNDPSELRKYYSLMGRSGVVKINTSIPNLEVPGSRATILRLHGIQASRRDVIDDAYVANARYPLFITTLLDQANITLDSNGKTILPLPKTDDHDQYNVSILLIDATGRVQFGEKVFEINVN